MASPVDAGRIGTNVATAATTWNINLPGSIAAGDLLIVFLRHASATQPSTSGLTGFTLLDWWNDDASDDFDAVYYKKATGSEGATVSYAPGASVKGCAIAFRITGAADPTIQAPERDATPAFGTAANINPGALTPTGGSKDYLFIVTCGQDGEGATFTSPSGYSTATTANSGTAGAVATNCAIAAATRQATVSSEDPGAWTNTAPATGVMAQLVAIHPAGAVEYTDSATVPFNLEVSGTELRELEDSASVYLDLQPSGSDVYQPAVLPVFMSKPIIVGGQAFQDRSRW